jgi:DNA-binding response OmpR family regulator
LAILLIQTGSRKDHSILSGLQGEYGPVECVPGMNAALKLARERHFDAFVLDLRRGIFDAASGVRELRSQEQLGVMLIVGGPASPAERIRLLEAGADDYLTEPVSERELAVRMRALLRRTSLLAQKLSVGDLELDAVRRQVTRQGKRIPLTAREFAVLECLLRNAGRPVSRRRIFEEVWNREGTTTNIVDVYINYLRAKVDRDFEPKLIRTVYGLGYVLASEQKQTA